MKPDSSPIHGSLLNRADKIGSLLSSLCAVHCLCLPVLIGLLPVVGLSFLASHKFEQAASVSMIVLAAACVWTGCRYHRRWGLLVLLGLGAALVLYIQFAGPAEADETQTDWLEAAAMMAGGLLIATSHLLNLKLRARCHCSQCESETKSSAPAKETRS
jgi:MerC mercury resistance protein